MEDIIDDDSIDLEELQAQIDLSMAQVKSLVDSWVDPNYGASTSKEDRAKQEKEIEELLRRPPRLGVGASAPASTSTSGREAVALKGKLVGKKRPREEEPIIISSQSEEEEESRAGAIKKKARVDPFEGKGKKKAQNKVASKPDPAPIKSASERPRTPDLKEKLPIRPATIVIPVMPPGDKSPKSSSTSKKRRKKKNKSAALATPVISMPSLTSGLPATETEQSEVIVVEDSPPHTPVERHKGHEQPDEKPKAGESIKSPVSGDSQFLSVPLLNLDGPPPVLGATPNKRKRRRKKKKKSDHQSQSTGDDVMDVDVQEVGDNVNSGKEESTELHSSKCRVI